MLDEFLHVLTDPAHVMAEVVFSVVLDVLVLGMFWPFILKAIRREHSTIDEEHGVENHGKPVMKGLPLTVRGNEVPWPRCTCRGGNENGAHYLSCDIWRHLISSKV